MTRAERGGAARLQGGDGGGGGTALEPTAALFAFELEERMECGESHRVGWARTHGLATRAAAAPCACDCRPRRHTIVPPPLLARSPTSVRARRGCGCPSPSSRPPTERVRWAAPSQASLSATCTPATPPPLSQNHIQKRALPPRTPLSSRVRAESVPRARTEATEAAGGKLRGRGAPGGTVGQLRHAGWERSSHRTPISASFISNSMYLICVLAFFLS